MNVPGLLSAGPATAFAVHRGCPIPYTIGQYTEPRPCKLGQCVLSYYPLAHKWCGFCQYRAGFGCVTLCAAKTDELAMNITETITIIYDCMRCNERSRTESRSPRRRTKHLHRAELLWANRCTQIDTPRRRRRLRRSAPLSILSGELPPRR